MLDMNRIVSLLSRAALVGCLALSVVHSSHAAEEELFTEEEKAKMVTTKSGLKYVDVKVGTGELVESGDPLKMHYTGRLMENGKKFDSSKDRGKPFDYTHKVSGVIPGWTAGVEGMRVGGVRKLLIPYRLGYGSRGAGAAIPPNADLYFEIEILEKVN